MSKHLRLVPGDGLVMPAALRGTAPSSLRNDEVFGPLIKARQERQRLAAERLKRENRNA